MYISTFLCSLETLNQTDNLENNPCGNIVAKGENAGNQYFLLFTHVFWPMRDKFHTEIVVCNSMGECNTILSAYTKYRHLG